MSETILFHKEDGVATITFNRPEKYNAFIREMALSFQSYLDECKNDPEIRVVVLTGAGKAFCAGQDLAEVVDPEGPALQKIVSEHFNPILPRIRNLEKPVVALVNGVAAGAGANIAIACDIVLASNRASFIQAFSKIGLIPDSGGTYFLPRLIGFQKAAAIMMLGDKVSAIDAEKMGMIYKACDPDTFKSEGKSIISKLAKMPTLAFALTKKALNVSMNNNLEAQLDVEDQLQTLAGQTNDYAEGVQAFLEKRPANFKGN